jgi:hypothetical protein
MGSVRGGVVSARQFGAGAFGPATQPDQVNRFELEARASKLAGLEAGLAKFSAFLGRPIRAVDLLKWDDVTWAQLAFHSGEHIPSPTTRSALIERLADRDAAVLAANARRQ